MIYAVLLLFSKSVYLHINLITQDSRTECSKQPQSTFQCMYTICVCSCSFEIKRYDAKCIWNLIKSNIYFTTVIETTSREECLSMQLWSTFPIQCLCQHKLWFSRKLKLRYNQLLSSCAANFWLDITDLKQSDPQSTAPRFMSLTHKQSYWRKEGHKMFPFPQSVLQ